MRDPFLILASSLGLLGLLVPGAAGGVVLALAWAALIAPSAGHLAGSSAGSLPSRLLPLAVWALVLSGLALARGADLSPLAALTLAGLYLFGVATGRLASGPLLGAGLWLALCVTLAGAATAWGQLTQPWPPAVAAWCIDISPLSLVLESAGVDWMRHPALYDPAGTLDIGPELRQAWRGELAGPGLFVLGCLALVVSSALRKRGAAPTPAVHRKND